MKLGGRPGPEIYKDEHWEHRLAHMVLPGDMLREWGRLYLVLGRSASYVVEEIFDDRGPKLKYKQVDLYLVTYGVSQTQFLQRTIEVNSTMQVLKDASR